LETSKPGIGETALPPVLERNNIAAAPAELGMEFSNRFGRLPRSLVELGAFAHEIIVRIDDQQRAAMPRRWSLSWEPPDQSQTGC
jgi:hypothetical protein